MTNLNGLRPQTSMDGISNFWVIKSFKKPSYLVNQLDDILKTSNELKTEGASKKLIIQKYIENPLILNNCTINLQTWIIISTVNNHLTIWLNDMCCLELCTFNTVRNAAELLNQHEMQKICNLKKFSFILRSMGVPNTNDCTSFSTIKNRIVASVLASLNVLNLRSNCFELFQSRFIVDNDLKTWLIDIKSDPTTDNSYNCKMNPLMCKLNKSLGKIIITDFRTNKTNIGLFKLVHSNSIEDNKYKPQTFIDRPKSKVYAKTRLFKNKLTKNETTHSHNIEYESEFNNFEQPESKLNFADIKLSLDRLLTGTMINKDEANHFLNLTNRWKDIVLSTQQHCRSIREKRIARKQASAHSQTNNYFKPQA